MEFADVVTARRMVRDFDPRPLGEGIVQRALERAVRAPSAGFTQGWDFVVLTSDAERSVFWDASAPTAQVGLEEAGAPIRPAAARTAQVGPKVAPGDSASAAHGPARDRWLVGVGRAPVLVVVCSRPEAYVDRYARPDKAVVGLGQDAKDWPIPYWDVDAGMAALLMLLSAVDDGIGGLFFGVPAGRHDAVRAALGIPTDRRLVGVVALGHPATPRRTVAPSRGGAGRNAHRPAARSLDEVVHRGRFGSPRPDDEHPAAASTE